MPRRYTILTDLQRDAVLVLTRYMSAVEVSEVFGVSDMTIWRIVRDPLVLERGRTPRRGDVSPSASVHSPPTLAASPVDVGAEGAATVPLRSRDIAETALIQSHRALAAGDALEAIRLVEAGMKVGELAELVKLLKARNPEAD